MVYQEKTKGVGLSYLFLKSLKGKAGEKRTVLYSGVDVCSLSLLSGNAIAGYLVSEAGLKDVNGLYCESGEYNGRSLFRKEGTNWEIFFQPTATTDFWWIDDERKIKVDAVYQNQSGSETPPLNGWGSILQAYNDPPTLSYQPCVTKSVPTVTEWGLIIMSLLLIGTAAWFIRRRKQNI